MKNTIDWVEVTRPLSINHHDEDDHVFAFCAIHYTPHADDLDVVHHAISGVIIGVDGFWNCDWCGRDLVTEDGMDGSHLTDQNF